MNRISILAGLFTLTLLFSCSDDIQYIGGDLVDDVNFSSQQERFPLVTYTKGYTNTGVQTNGPNAGALGLYKHPIYGRTQASTLSQIVLNQSGAQFPDGVVLDSAILYLPFYSRAVLTEEGETKYEIDSVYGGNSLSLSMYRSDYYLSDFDASDIARPAKYYSNQLDEFSGIKGQAIFENDTVQISEETIRNDVYTYGNGRDELPTDTTTTRLLPGIYVKMDTQFWEENITGFSDSNVFASNNTFKNFFRGLYLETAAVNDEESYFLFNLLRSRVTLFYSQNDISQSVSFNFEREDPENGNSLNLSNTVVGYTNEYNQDVIDLFDDTNTEAGEEHLYLKGGQGAMAVIDLFGADTDNNGIPEELEALREEDLLIRQAQITFYVDQDQIAALGGAGLREPERLYIYNLSTNRFLPDYSANLGSGSSAGTGVLSTHLGGLVRADDGSGYSYTIDVTEYLKQLLQEDNENPDTRLGLTVSSNVLLTATAALRDVDATETPSRIPFSSIYSQQGTILHGNLSSDVEKRPQLKVFYTTINTD